MKSNPGHKPKPPDSPPKQRPNTRPKKKPFRNGNPFPPNIHHSRASPEGPCYFGDPPGVNEKFFAAKPALSPVFNEWSKVDNSASATK